MLYSAIPSDQSDQARPRHHRPKLGKGPPLGELEQLRKKQGLGVQGNQHFHPGLCDWGQAESELGETVKVFTSTAAFKVAEGEGHAPMYLDAIANSFNGGHGGFKRVHGMEEAPSAGAPGAAAVHRRRRNMICDAGTDLGNTFDAAAKAALVPLGPHDPLSNPDLVEGAACHPRHIQFDNKGDAIKYRSLREKSQGTALCEEYEFITFSAAINFKSHEYECPHTREKVMVFQKANGKYVSLSDEHVDLHAFEFKTCSKGREEFRTGRKRANIWGIANRFFCTKPDYSEELLENLSFIVMLKEPNNSSGDLYLLPRLIGQKRKRPGSGSLPTYAYDYAKTHASKDYTVGKGAIDDAILFAHLEGLSHTQ